MNKRRVIISILIVCVFLVIASSLGLASDDPLITESYLNNVFFKKITGYIDSLNSGQQGGSGSTYKVVSVSNGQKFVGGEGCEFILRQGSGTIIASALGGLSDVTAGSDLANLSNVPPNHLLIVPRADGRGFKATANVLIMVKGSYTLE